MNTLRIRAIKTVNIPPPQGKASGLCGSFSLGEEGPMRT